MKSEIEKGLEIENEHRDLYNEMRKYADHFYRGKVEIGVSFPSFDEFKLKIVLSHISEDILYYTHLEAMEQSHRSTRSRISKYKK